MEFSLFTVFDNYKNYQESFERTPERFLNEVLEQTVMADRLGYNSVWFAEHHFSEYGILTSPHVFMAAAAQRTSKIRLGVSVKVLPFHHPLNVAEDYALVDVLSNGRLNLGLGSGYLPHEFSGFNLDGKDKALRFNDALAVIEKAWKGEKFSHLGEYYQFTDVKLEVTPKQKEVPTWIATLSQNGANYVAKMGYNMMGIPYVACNSISELKEIIDSYKDTYRKAGHDEKRVKIPLALHTYVAETTEEAEATAKPHLDLYLDTRMYGKNAKYEDLRDREQVLIGSPKDVITMLKKYENVGCDHIMMLMNFGGLPYHKVLQSMELIAKEVMPAFKSTHKEELEV
ncbi:LLM class flavin-dependent oxidoreductase [Bacillus aquiflavi]|uniref:LLM class flavin-dependent oxidoreductase n=1 Tax=Bacillus aquiflavi TaxID=2672567 RepID=A0A6B3VWX4_9BACI|nr:LLM class flavin-dependent oxidoreductase [Bacillus aquiflavi]MBA4537502.1 LLM class flavin-dependent oxidoreductase [Bacillus aquiflavi]NEY81758.1 LLM class flavin-dependent oxidoreductase [Bacillus aquiflavi]UAC47466.1 LLM class flavin-dependent oxidoreductase [Bacillus aquiflavi]